MLSLVAAALTGGMAAASDHPPAGADACSGCHSTAEGAPPRLDRLSAAQIDEALAGYRAGTRAGTVMPRIAKGFSPAESRAIAAFLGRATETGQ